ncbi:MAG: hypothetical protein E7316_07530 [Clostridiales bacterium]|nr:hypothetical protein [Clostridiales bacterium]
MRRLPGLILTLMMLLCIAPAHAAEDVFTVNVQNITGDAWSESFIESSLTSDRSYLQVTCPLEGDAAVTLSVTDAMGSPVYQRDYGVCSGKFRSEDIFLRLSGSQTTYHVTLWVGDAGYSFPLRRVMPKLVGNAACSAGYPLASLTGSGSWKTATLLDVAGVSLRPLTVPLYASGAYEIGTVTFAVEGGCLTVSAHLDEGVHGSIDQSSIQVATTALEAETLGKKSFSGAAVGLDRPVDLQGTPYAAVYVNLTVSFDPSGAAPMPATDSDMQQEQQFLWNKMQMETANEALG